MADSSTSMAGTSNTRQSSRIAKRLKTEPRGTDTGSGTDTDTTGIVVAPARKQQKQTTISTKGSNAKPPPSFIPASLCSTGTYKCMSSPLECDFILHNIFSFVGEFQYVFIGSVNQTFHKTYVSLFPKKRTQFNASTIEYAKSCWGIICKINDDETKDEEKRKLWRSAARYGNIEVVKYLLELLPPVQQNVSFKNVSWENRQKIDWKYDLCYTAAKYGQMELLQWACDENICVAKDDQRVCQFAIGHGHFEIFHWARKNGFRFEDADFAAFEASRQGNIEALKWLHDKYDVIRPLYMDNSCGCCNSAAACGQIDVLKWINESYEAGWNGDTLNFAVSGGHLSTVQFLLENECGWRHNTYSIAAHFGHLAILKLLRSLDPDWDEGDDSTVTAHAAGGGHLEIIEWAIENGWPLTKSACKYAAGCGQLDTLKWLRTRGCPWDSDTTKYAATDEIYKWAKKNGCPVAKGNPREKLNDDYEWLG